MATVNTNITTIEDMEVLTSLQLGIDYVIKHTQGKKEVLSKDFNSIDTISFPREGSETTPPHDLNSFVIKTYASEAFQQFRSYFSIDSDEFYESICQRPLKSLNNPGASGSLFFMTEDDNYVIKTVSEKEARFLQQLLPGYWLNIHQNSKTLLPKFFGLFAYKTLQKSMRFVIMNNVLPSSIKYHLKFDLKGSSYNRKANENDLFQEALPVTFKDNDFQDRISEGFLMSLDKRELLVDNLERDCGVLESFEIMDYSLLVGVHNVTQVLKEASEKAALRSKLPPKKGALRSILRQRMSIDINHSNYDSSLIEKRSIQLSVHLATIPDGGFPVKLPNGDFAIVFVGIIDILQNFRTKKRIEHAVKSLIVDGDTISVQKPSFYAKRFLKFMTEDVFKEVSAKKKRIVTFGSVRRNSLVDISNADEYSIPEDYPDRPGSAEGERKMGMLKRQATIEMDPLLTPSNDFNYREGIIEGVQRARKNFRFTKQAAVEET